MRHARLMPLGLLSVVLLVGCATAPPGWTYAPAPSVTPAPSSASSGVPSAGASGAAPSAGASGAAPSAGTSGAPASSGIAQVKISATGIKYDQTTVTAPAGTPFQIVFDNNDPGTPHNVTIHLGGATGAELFKGEIFNGVGTRTYSVPALDAGAYAFVCSVHPTMVGTLNAQ